MLQFGAPFSTASSFGAIQIANSYAAVHFERLDGRDEHDGARLEVVEPGLDVHELLEPEVRAESCLCHHVVCVAERQPVGYDGVAAVSYVSKRGRCAQARAGLQPSGPGWDG